MQWETEGNRAAAEVLTGIYGKEPVGFRLGGSIPFMFHAKSVLGLDTTMFAISYEDENQHAPNENWEVKSAAMGEIAYVRLFKRFEERGGEGGGGRESGVVDGKAEKETVFEYCHESALM